MSKKTLEELGRTKIDWFSEIMAGQKTLWDEIYETRAQRDKWQDIAERLYNATMEADYTVMMRAVKAYEEAASEREEG